MAYLQDASDGFEFPQLNVSAAKMVAQCGYLSGRVAYVWGGKAVPLDVDEAELTGLDCSGFFDVSLYHGLVATGAISGVEEFPKSADTDSADIHEWIKEIGLKESEVVDGSNQDGVLRIFVLPPLDGEPGHIGWIYEGHTIECYGGNGVGRRLWAPEKFGWMGKTDIYVARVP